MDELQRKDASLEDHLALERRETRRLEGIAHEQAARIVELEARIAELESALSGLESVRQMQARNIEQRDATNAELLEALRELHDAFADLMIAAMYHGAGSDEVLAALDLHPFAGKKAVAAIRKAGGEPVTVLEGGDA